MVLTGLPILNLEPETDSFGREGISEMPLALAYISG